MKRALVLSGGGAKGSYQIGVWKAIRKLYKKIDIVVGTSIGSINAAMVAQKEYKNAKKLWLNIKTKDLFDYDTSKDLIDNKENIKKIISNKGLENDKAINFLKTVINEQKIRSSKIKYGLVTYNLKTKTPKYLSIENIPNGKLIDYIFASSTCFPIIEKKEIDGEYYIDGGFYDNMPINLAIDMGANEIIAVDLSVLSIKQKIKDNNVKVDIIKNKDKKLFSLDFNKEYAKKQIAIGYNDTMKYFKQLDGNIYTFKKNDLSKNYNKINKYYIDLLNKILLTQNNNAIVNQIFKISKYNKIFTDIKQNKKIDNIINDSLEYLATIFSIPNEKIYNITKFNKTLIRKAKELEYIKLDKNLKGKMLIGYIYNKYMNSEDKEKEIKELFNIALIFQKDFLSAIYLIAISKHYPLTLKNEEYYKELYKSAYKY